MLILAHAGAVGDGPTSSVAESKDRSAIKEFERLSGDKLLYEKSVMLVSVDASANRLLAARLGIPIDSGLPSLVFLQGDRVFHHKGAPTSSEHMRSYALQGYQNQGAGAPLRRASPWLRVRTAYLGWLFHGDVAAGHVNMTALMASAFVAGLAVAAAVAIVVALPSADDGAAAADTKGKKAKEQ